MVHDIQRGQHVVSAYKNEDSSVVKSELRQE